MKKVKKLTEEKVIKAIETHMLNKGWNTKSKKGLREKGCDLEMVKGTQRLFCECKGKSYADNATPVNENSFIYALGQIVTRMTTGSTSKNANIYALGLCKESAQKALRRIPSNFAKSYNIHIFSVNEENQVTESTPKDFKN